jgi:heme/copper-type cytochrome/quinol oxidase subunit 1
MTPRAFATILVRILGVWLSIEALSRLGELVVWASNVRRGPDATGWTSYPPIETTVGTSELYLHDTYYVISHATVSFVPAALKLLLGVVSIVAARRVARLVCSGIDQPTV